jgi:methylenetetrahydrofolate dehydrogenase (NADP+)/methenyltetrahydrofolate cyclohydrolase
MKRCEKLGLTVKRIVMPADTAQENLIDAIRELNRDRTIHGVLLFRPLPKRMDDLLICNSLLPEKDIDGITNASMAGVFTGTPIGYPPCTPQACMEILDHYGIDPKGQKAVVVGRSLVVGKPAAMMLIHKHATVTVCHTKTEDLPGVCRTADILIVAAGRQGLADKNCLSPGQIILDVGINVDADGCIRGDVDFAQAEPVARAITPVPGGVGTVTTSVLAKHVVMAAAKTVFTVHPLGISRF